MKTDKKIEKLAAKLFIRFTQKKNFSTENAAQYALEHAQIFYGVIQNERDRIEKVNQYNRNNPL